jgi:hypothetical protein
MPEFSRISIREAQEHARSSLRATESLITRARSIGASTVADDLDEAANELAGALRAFERADKYLQQKAGLLPPTAPGSSPAE